MARDAQQISTFIVEWLEEHLGTPVSAEAEFAALGIDSLDAVALTDALAGRLGIDELPVAMMLEHPSIAALAIHLTALP